jgi:predicted transposase/invertase (TIGR01784 family)
MLDYRIRVYRRFPNKQMRQVVIYLQPTNSDKTREISFSLENTHHQFEVIRLWEQPPESFLQAPGLLPFAVLGQTEDRIQILQQVAQSIDQISDSRIQSNILSSAYILAGLVLDRESIRKILRRELMRESVTYQEILEEGLEEGRQQGLQQSLRQMVINLLQENISLDVIVRVTGLSVEEIEQIQSAQTSEEENNA